MGAASAAAAPPLHVRLAFSDSAIPAPIQQAAIAETARLWAPYAIDVTATEPAAHVEPSVALRIVSDVRTERRSGDLGELRFAADGTPQPIVTVFYGVVAKLATSGDVMEVNPEQYPTRVRNDAIGRALSRVIAHELGHFLLRSPHHPSSGLMRRRFEAAVLAEPNDAPFALTETDRARLDIVRRALYPAPDVIEAGTGAAPGSSRTAALVR